MKDSRDPEQLGSMIIQLKEIYPDKTTPERADMIEEWLAKGIPFSANSNGK